MSRHVIRLVCVLATCRALTVIARDEPLAGGLFLAGCLCVWVGWSPGFMAGGAVACSLLMTHQTGSVVLFAWVAFACALLDGDELRVALRSQVVVVYGFAVAHKLVSSAFMSGSVIHTELPGLPYPELAAVGVVALEAVLAVLVVRRSRLALPLAVAAHVPFAVVMAQGWVHLVALSAFNLHMILLIWLTSDIHDENRPLVGGRVLREPVGVDR